MRKSIDEFKDIHHHCPDPRNNTDPSRIVNINFNEEIPRPGYYSIGIHPWNTSEMNTADIDKAIDQMTAKLVNENIVAVGECGIDLLRGGEKDLQEYAFRRQIELSERFGLPLIIHMVKSTETIISIKKEMNPKQQWIIHGFRGKPELAGQLVRQGIGLSFGKNYNKQAFDCVPEKMRYLETDED